MKIINMDKGEEYNLRPDTKIEVERTNPFFNDYGEQTTPLELPASERNRRILGFPDSFGRREKMTAVDVAIQDGAYYAQCRQVILSAQYKGSISTSFYINDGSFYSRIQKVKLKDIFGDEFIPGVLTVEEGIAFCRRLRANDNPKFGIFPVLIEDDSGVDTGFNYKILNAFGKERVLKATEVFMWKDGQWQTVTVNDITAFDPDAVGEECDFYNAVQRTEYVNQIPVTLTPGYYITPFIRANYLLKRIFQYFGYTLLPHFFEQTPPFDKMVVLNNTMDSLVNGKIRLADLVPDISCKDFLSVFRKKFCCEFAADEANRTADIIFLRDALAAAPAEDLTDCVTAEPVVSYNSEKDYRRIVLGSENHVSTEISESYDDMASMLKANPGAYLDPVDGAFYKQGFSGDYSVITKIGEASQDYNTGGELEANEIKVPDAIPEFRTLKHKAVLDGADVVNDMGTFLFIGNYFSPNSKMVVTAEDNEEISENAEKQSPMLAFCYRTGGRPAGTISSYDIYSSDRPRIFDYALYYNGADGIFEKFYRDYDQLLRNSLHEMKVPLLLSQLQKQHLPAYAKVILRGVPFFFNKLKFTLGGKNEPVESELLSVSLMEPVVSAPTIGQMLPAMLATYKWVGRIEQTKVTKSDYENSGLDQNRTFVTIYPPIPDASYVGIQYGRQSSFASKKVRHATLFRRSKWEYTRIDVWLECVPL